MFNQVGFNQRLFNTAEDQTLQITVGEAPADGLAFAMTSGTVVSVTVGEATAIGLVAIMTSGAVVSITAGEAVADGLALALVPWAAVRPDVGAADAEGLAFAMTSGTVVSVTVGEAGADGLIISVAHMDMITTGEAYAEGLYLTPSFAPFVEHNTIDLFKYLPRYYLESRIMKALMDAMSGEVPDAINYLWKAFFANTCPDEGFWLWLREYDARTREEVYAKMRGGGALNLEMLQALDIEAVETYKLCPEEGIVLSGNDAYFADGIYIGPLISDIYVDPDEVQVAQQLIALAGMAGFRYWLAVKSKSLVPKAPEQSYSSIALYPSYIFPSPDDYLSGQMVLTCSRVTTSIENKSLAKITHWFSPVAFFDENRYWTDDSNPGAVSKVTTSEMEMIRIFPTGDTYLDYLAPDINNNDETILSVGGEGVDSLDRSDYALLKFDLSGFELPRVYSCELFLYVASTRHFNLHTYPFDVFLLASPFDEETVTPNTAPTRLPEHVARIYLPDPLEENSDGTWISWDISSVLEFWKVHPNYGLLLTHTGYENEGYDAVYFASVNYYEGNMDNAGNWAPYLQIII